jgi:hypothetical protein
MNVIPGVVILMHTGWRFQRGLCEYALAAANLIKQKIIKHLITNRMDNRQLQCKK